MVLFLFVVASVAVVIAMAVRDRRSARYAAFAEAARELGFVAAKEGPLYRRIWLHGNRDGLRFHAEPFRVSANGVKEERMGYRVIFPRSVETASRGGDDPRLAVLARLDTAFLERQVDADRLFCVRRSVPLASEQLVEDARTVLAAARSFAGLPLGTGDPGPPAFRVPPPLPAAEDEAPPEKEASAQAPPPPPLPERSGAADGQAAEAAEAEEAVASPPPSDAGRHARIQEPSTDPEPSPDSLPAPAPPPSFAELPAVALDLFGSGRNHYETGRRFDERHRGGAASGRARLRGVAPYAHDRIFGRGPGLLATMEIEAAPALDGAAGDRPPAPVTLVAELSTGDEALAEAPRWRARAGEEILVVGRLLRCDAFSRTLYLGEALCEEEGEEEGET